MKLTGKCKEDFENWFQSKSETHYRLVEWFESLDENMQYGVYVDFFDGVGIKIHIQYSDDFCIGGLEGFFYTIDYRTYSKSLDTRQEAREQSIIKANEIYNNHKEI